MKADPPPSGYRRGLEKALATALIGSNVPVAQILKLMLQALEDARFDDLRAAWERLPLVYRKVIGRPPTCSEDDG